MSLLLVIQIQIQIYLYVHCRLQCTYIFVALRRVARRTIHF